jgi:hypothetical protein
MNRTPPDNTEEQQAPRWQPGQSGNPAGRPKGSRNKLSEAFLHALADDFDANGAEVIERVRQERPHDYLKVCASVMPKRLENENVTPIQRPEDMSDEELLSAVMTSSEWGEMSNGEKLKSINLVTDRLQRLSLEK